MKKVLSLTAIVVLLLLVMAPATSAAPPASGGSGGSHYTVHWGDTLFSIGRRFGVNPYRIAQANGLSNPNRIYAGQVLYIPSGGGYRDGCGYNDCNYNPRPKPQPCQYGGCYNQGYYPRPDYGHGYDNAGYYYYNYQPTYKRYSYPCGYYSNCYSY
jgi:LysM repeat protein